MTKHLFLKLEKKNLWKTWGKFLMEHHLEEAKETLREENLIRETNWVIETDEGDFVYYEHETAEGAKLPWDESHTLNWLHSYIFGACLFDRVEGEEAKKLFEQTKKLPNAKVSIGYNVEV